jgi:hypothetical protein
LGELRHEIALADDLPLRVERGLSRYMDNITPGDLGYMSVTDW